MSTPTSPPPTPADVAHSGHRGTSFLPLLVMLLVLTAVVAFVGLLTAGRWAWQRRSGPARPLSTRAQQSLPVRVHAGEVEDGADKECAI
ncbi:unnamed protein product [Linum trigynum]|uniref:Uncharacterized protein n=1 Tax=Linum trigynum TaxID=586398 RepID=A0AAV2D1R3_9ROSI